MTRPRHGPHRTDEAEKNRAERLRREADALRENLRRRKAQARARADAAGAQTRDPAPGSEPDATG